MTRLTIILYALSFITCAGQTLKSSKEETMIKEILIDPSSQEIKGVLNDLRAQDLSPKKIVIHDSISLSNSNKLYVLSHKIDGFTHYGAVITPINKNDKKLPVIIFATGGDGMHKDFNIGQDFSHPAIQFPNFLGDNLDDKFIVIIPSFRGQQLIIDDKKYQSGGDVSDAFEGATTDALAFLNVTLKTFKQTNKNQVAIFGGSRGGTVALLASSRDKRIKRTIVVAAPTDMKALYQLYPNQFKLLFFNDLLTGKISILEARKKFISISPIYFIDELPLVQLHHDKNDPFVPLYFAEKLTENMKSHGKNINSYFYNEGIHGFWTDKNYWNRVQEFIRPLTD